MDTHRTNTFAANNAHGDAKPVTGYQVSPFPEIDAYIRSQLNKGGVQGDIRCWKFYECTGLLVYEATKNRWCENVGRAHRSNNTCYLVDLHQGIFYQKCHDQECKAINFRSQNYPLPQECLPKSILSRARRCCFPYQFKFLDAPSIWVPGLEKMQELLQMAILYSTGLGISLCRSNRFGNFPGEAGDKDDEGHTQNQTDTATSAVEDTHMEMST